MSAGLRPYYDGGPLKTLEALSAVTGTSSEEMAAVEGTIAEHYREVRLKKKDGSERICWDPSKQLRRIQRGLVVNLLRRVHYPDYLHGGLPGRDYLSNAAVHVGARWCACMDIKRFFPSITPSLVGEAVWRGFFGCSEQISDRLTALTTLGGELPQGSLTASYIANLVLWRHEPRLVSLIRADGFQYTRYIDDISISARTYPETGVKTRAIGGANRMLRLNGFAQKRSKLEISSSSKGAVVVGLHVGRHGVGRSKHERRALATDVLSYAGLTAAMVPAEATKLAKSLYGRIAELGRHHDREAQHLRMLLDAQTQ